MSERGLPTAVFLAFLAGMAVGAWAVLSGFVAGWVEGFWR